MNLHIIFLKNEMSFVSLRYDAKIEDDLDLAHLFIRYWNKS